jgi:hypothetical protein
LTSKKFRRRIHGTVMESMTPRWEMVNHLSPVQ